MNIQEAYNTWAANYDTAPNKTRDLEAVALRALLPTGPHAEVVDLGCGTGKNTAWLATQATHLTAVDFSADMLAQARAKNQHLNVSFHQADITQPWQFLTALADVLTCSLILEHIQNLDSVFAQAQKALRPGGVFYIGELHPFKQYQGSKARFDTAEGSTFELECHVHHISDFMESARRHGLRCMVLQEWFDKDNHAGTPRLVSFLFQREGQE
jgi:ubiquinone/menaquinone biosynthesis C-methylase UbiE